ncbi:hypothetical protein BGW80DRAFT_1251818 [Lactifluus volemus]|nr:hypothetical protein BGW80DRAFT_1251818 [Lactifluus volemus]
MEQIQQQPLGSTVGMSTAPTAYTHITLTDSTIQLGCGGSGGELVPGHPSASIEYGELSGNPPAIFDGERTHSEAFFLQFTLFRRINANHHVMVVPFYRALLALSYMQGPKVDRWMQERVDELVHLTNTGTKLTDEALWANFEQKFWTTFADTNKKMKGDDLETYVSTFEHLRREAGWGRDEPGTIVLFREGLKHHLHKAIIERACQMPVTMDDWQSAARTEQAVWMEGKEAGTGQNLTGIKGTTEEATSVENIARNGYNMAQWRIGGHLRVYMEAEVPQKDWHPYESKCS